MRAARSTAPTAGVLLMKNRCEHLAQRARDWSGQREKLLELQEQSVAHIHELVSLAAEEKPEFSTHLGDAATDTFDRDLTLSLVSFEQEKLYEIEAALKRIDDGSYGVCELTGQLIPRVRLDAIPWTRFSEAAERHLGTTSHPHLGVLHSVRIMSDNESADDVDAMEAD